MLVCLILLTVEASSTPLSADVGHGLTDAVDSEPLGVASADKPKAASIPKSSSVDIPVTAAAAAAAAAAGSSSFKTSLGLGKVQNNIVLDL